VVPLNGLPLNPQKQSTSDKKKAKAEKKPTDGELD